MKDKTFLSISPKQYLKLIYFDQRIMFTAQQLDENVLDILVFDNQNEVSKICFLDDHLMKRTNMP